MLSEDGLIRLIQRTIKSRGQVRLGIGDDAAVLKDGTVISTDAYAQGVHFDLSYMTLRQVGERCACGAISDVVAMAAKPAAVLVALALPSDLRSQIADCRLQNGRQGKKNRQDRQERQGVDGEKLSAAGREPLVLVVRELYRGIENVCAEMGCEVVGGDIIAADQLLLALTVTGKTRRPKLRAGARPGDRLYVSGYLGSAEAGRIILAEEVRSQKPKVKGQNGERRMAKGDWRLPLVSRHLRPVPRLGVMRETKSLIHGLIDTSDGLATDARHLTEMSGVKIVLAADALPILPATRRFCAERGCDPLSFVLGAGEDYELLFTSSRRITSNVRGVKVTRIGCVERGRGLWIHADGKTFPVTTSGYDHLKREGRTCW
jgi:thiamine-monophosphate kinase